MTLRLSLRVNSARGDGRGRAPDSAQANRFGDQRVKISQKAEHWREGNDWQDPEQQD